MARLLSVRHTRDLLMALALALCAGAILLYPTQSIEAARGGLQLCGNVIVPSLFPFFVLSGFCVESGLTRYLGRLMEPVMRPLFGVGGACASAFVLGLIGGYPVGARTAIALYEKNTITRAETERLLAFCNNCGPAFIFGVVGAGIFSSSKLGLLLFAVHILASVLVGVLFRFLGPVKESRAACIRVEAVSFFSAFTGAIRQALQSTLSICAFIIFFAVLIRLLVLSGILTAAASVLGTLLLPLGFSPAWAERLMIGAIELSSGVASLSGAPLGGSLAMAAFLLGWAGLCVHCQVLSFLGGSGLSVRTYLLGKLCHGLLSALLIGLLLRLLPIDLPVSALYAQEITALAGINFSQALRASTLTAGIVWAAFCLVSVVFLALGSGHSSRNRV